MFTARIQNANGQILALTGNESEYQVVSIAGLNPPTAQLNMTTSAGLDGARFNSATLNTRNIVITIKINGNVEANRQNLYRFFRTKEACRFFYRNRSRDVFIDGWVESVTCDLFSNSERAQISIICPQPYFRDLEMIIDDISSTAAAFEFPFAINVGEPIPFSEFDSSSAANVYNDSEADVGVIIELTFSRRVNEVEIRNVETGESFTLEYSFNDRDLVTINTNRGSKSVTLQRGGSSTNIFTAVASGSVFFQLAVGDNRFIYLADGGSANQQVDVIFAHYNSYRGV